MEKLFKDSFQHVSDADGFRQGDIILPFDEKNCSTDLPYGSAGVIITADCDIANDKFGDFFSFIPLVPAPAFLERFWAPAKLQGLVDEACEAISIQIHKAEKRRDPAMQRLSNREVLSWYLGRGRDVIFKSIDFHRGEVSIVNQQIHLLSVMFAEGSPITQLQAAWQTKGLSIDLLAKDAKKSFLDLTKAASFFLLPDLPSLSTLGYVATMRDVRSLHASRIYRTRAQLPIHRSSDECMFRIGRFSDRIRFAIVQRFASLFARIGMTRSFDEDCKVLPDLVVSSIFNSKSVGNTND